MLVDACRWLSSIFTETRAKVLLVTFLEKGKSTEQIILLKGNNSNFTKMNKNCYLGQSTLVPLQLFHIHHQMQNWLIKVLYWHCVSKWLSLTSNYPARNYDSALMILTSDCRTLMGPHDQRNLALKFSKDHNLTWSSQRTKCS